MRKRLSAILISSGAAAAVALGTTAALASSINATWTVSPGGSFSSSGSGQVKDATTGTVAKCTSISLNGTLKSGSGLSGTGIGSVTSASFSGCTIGTIGVNVAVHGLPWKLNAKKFSSTTGVTTGNVTGIDLVATTTGCSATLDGTAAGANNGITGIKYSNSTGKITLTSGSGANLHSWGVVGCFGLVNNGDIQKASGTLTVSPKQTITSP
jgi:hypothetical protein